MESANYSAISLFSGAGGLDVGFARSGFEIIWANDFDRDACLTYEANLGSHIECGDINDFLQKLYIHKNNIDVVFGGPPCQGFSVAGKMDPNDKRSQLIWSFLKAVEIISPKVFVMENVKSLATLTKFEKIRNNLFKKATQLGYSLDLVVLNSMNFGVPQSRERMFFVGFKKNHLTFSFEKMVNRYKKEPKNIREIICALGKAGGRKNPRICNAKITLASNPVLRKSPYAGMLFNGQGRPINPDLVSCTLHASMGGNRTPIIDERHLFDNGESWIEEYHKHLMKGGKPSDFGEAPNFLRRLTVDEAIRIQTFPNDYEFIGKQSSVFRQIGNAVPCKLAECIANATRDLLSTVIQD